MEINQDTPMLFSNIAFHFWLEYFKLLITVLIKNKTSRFEYARSGMNHYLTQNLLIYIIVQKRIIRFDLHFFIFVFRQSVS